jgi:protein TonB
MKFLFFLLLINTVHLNAQREEHHHVGCIEEAKFSGGNEALESYLTQNLHYPERALKEKIEGKVIIHFMVDKDGSIGKVKLKTGFTNCPECNEEAVRLIKSMPSWSPYKIHDKSYNSYLSIPIVFKIK